MQNPRGLALSHRRWVGLEPLLVVQPRSTVEEPQLALKQELRRDRIARRHLNQRLLVRWLTFCVAPGAPVQGSPPR